MARSASVALSLVLTVALASCQETVPPAPAGPTTAERLGVVRGADILQDPRDAAEFDSYVARYADMSCRTLSSTIAALRARDATPAGGAQRVARIGGAIVPGPIGSITRVIGSDLAASSAARGNLRLAAAEAVRVAKGC